MRKRAFWEVYEAGSEAPEDLMVSKIYPNEGASDAGLSPQSRPEGSILVG